MIENFYVERKVNFFEFPVIDQVLDFGIEVVDAGMIVDGRKNATKFSYTVLCEIGIKIGFDSEFCKG
jgi:hypothetical protein